MPNFIFPPLITRLNKILSISFNVISNSRPNSRYFKFFSLSFLEGEFTRVKGIYLEGV